MEASTETASLTPRIGALEVLKKFLKDYGLILALLILPVVYGIQDLREEGDVGRLAENLKDGLSNGAI